MSASYIVGFKPAALRQICKLDLAIQAEIIASNGRKQGELFGLKWCLADQRYSMTISA